MSGPECLFQNFTQTATLQSTSNRLRNILGMNKTVGVLGGGQLGRMLVEAANRLNIRVLILDAEGCPASQVNGGPSNLVKGSFKDSQAIQQLANQSDVLTIEIEHVDTKALQNIDASNGAASGERQHRVEIHPHWKTIEIIQDKYEQKDYLKKRRIPVANQVLVKTNEDISHYVRYLGGYPVMLKARKDAYDGRGNFPLKSDSDIPEAVHALGDRDLYVEEWANFTMELAVMVVKTKDEPDSAWESATMAFPVVETVHQASILKLAFNPPRKVHKTILNRAQEFARKAVACFEGKGIFGVEMFLLQDGELLINEIAPRPHNSGHFTIDACPMSQFEAHLRAILDIPIPPRSLEATQAAVMLNILGTSTPTGHLEVLSEAYQMPGAAIHMYGKGDGRKGRKMGHITVTADTLVEAVENIQPLVDLVDRMGTDEIFGEASQPSRQNENARSVGIEQTSSISSSASPAKADDIQVRKPPQVAITMGSDSDRSVLAPGAALLDEFGISYVSNITSAHRTPERMFKFASEAADNGIKVILAAAGGAAHLPGMIAACTRLPVIGIPVKATRMEGIDSLLSIVQMPKGCPVATVGIDNSLNAAQLAIRILATTDNEIKQKLDRFLQEQTDTVIEKGERMQELGIRNYIWP